MLIAPASEAPCPQGDSPPTRQPHNSHDKNKKHKTAGSTTAPVMHRLSTAAHSFPCLWRSHARNRRPLRQVRI